MTKTNRSRLQGNRNAKRHATTRRTAPPLGMVDADSDRNQRSPSSSFPTYQHGWWSDRVEWMRGKTELAMETSLAPLLSWLGDVPSRLFGGWGARARISGHSRRRARARFLWSWDEQGVRMLKKLARIGLAVAVSALVLVVLGLVAIRVAGAVAHVKSPTDSLFGSGAGPTTAPNSAAVTIRNDFGGDATMLPAPTYTLGMWSSDMTPGGVTTIYARVSNNSAPVAGVMVSIYYNGRSLGANTNGFGLAIFTIPASGARGQPVTVNGSVHINGQEIDAQTFYTPN